MPLDPRKKQKKLERRKAKDKARRKTQLARHVHYLAHRFERAAHGAVLHSLVPIDLWDQGIGQVVLSRDLGDGRVAFAVFLLDVFCLGVKDVAHNIISREEYDLGLLFKLQEQFEFKSRSPEYVRKLIEDAVDYAQSLGLEPHSDYRQAKAIFGEIDAAACRETFEFGRDGKPFFVSGPYDSPMRCRTIVAALHDHCGQGQYDYVAHISAREAGEMGLSQLFPDERVLELDDHAAPGDDGPGELHFQP